MSLGECRRVVCFETGVQLGKDLFAASEVVVTQVGDVPNALWLFCRRCCFVLSSIEVLVYCGIITNDLALHCLIVYLIFPCIFWLTHEFCISLLSLCFWSLSASFSIVSFIASCLRSWNSLFNVLLVLNLPSFVRIQRGCFMIANTLLAKE